jgi:hypothetical protein
MISSAMKKSARQSLDRLVAQMAKPGFIYRFRRPPRMTEQSGHVSPAMLSLESPRSRYVKKWRRHARQCPICSETFRYFGLSLD